MKNSRHELFGRVKSLVNAFSSVFRFESTETVSYPVLTRTAFYAGLCRSEWFRLREPANQEKFRDLVVGRTGDHYEVDPVFYRPVIENAVAYVLRSESRDTGGARAITVTIMADLNAILYRLPETEHKEVYAEKFLTFSASQDGETHIRNDHDWT